jgi:DNA-binding CsgD family transcriptional regulator
MWDERAHRARLEITALAASGFRVSELHAAAIQLTSPHVPTDLSCWAAIDPETLVISAMTSGETRIAAEFEPLLAEAEYRADEPHSFATLARRRTMAARLSEMSAAERRRSARLNTVWRPLGLDRELRLMFHASDGTCWGGAGMARAGQDFTDREITFLTALAPTLATATRLAVLSEAQQRSTGGHPAIVLVGSRGEVRATTAAAQEWQERLDEIATGRFVMMMQVMAVGARASASGGFRARVPDARGRWALLEASPLLGGEEGQVAVIIGPVTGNQLMGLLLAAYELTPRERQICSYVVAGRSTADMAEQLFISANTVQDHLKSVFAKVGVRSRGELVARLRAEEPVTMA